MPYVYGKTIGVYCSVVLFNVVPWTPKHQLRIFFILLYCRIFIVVLWTPKHQPQLFKNALLIVRGKLRKKGTVLRVDT